MMTTTTRTTALERWLRFSDALASEAIDVLGTEDVVAALIDRSLLQDELDAGFVLDPPTLTALDSADRALKAAAPVLLDRTDISLFKDDEPVSHWWWHIEQLVLGHAASALLSVPEAAAAKGVHPHTIRAAIRAKVLPARTLARGFLIHRRDLERWEPRRVGRPRGTRGRASDPLLEAFNDANTSGDFARARDIARAIERQPLTPRRQLALALAEFNAGAVVKAVEWAESALLGDLPPQSRQTALLVLGRAQLTVGSTAEALETLQTAHGVAHLDALVSAAMADAHLALGDANQAVMSARRAMVEDPSRPELKYVAARMEWHNDQVWDALEHIVQYRAQRDDPDGALLHCALLGYLGDQLGDDRCYERVLEILADSRAEGLDAARTKAVALARLHRPTEALAIVPDLLTAKADDDDVRRAAENVASAIVRSISLDDRNATTEIVTEIERVVGPTDATRRAKAFQHALRGDVGAVQSELGANGNRRESEDEVLIGIAYAESSAAADAGRMFRKVVDASEDIELLHTAVVGGLRIDDLELVGAALLKLAGQQSGAGWAQTALGILDSARRVARAELLTQSLGGFVQAGDAAMGGSSLLAKPADSIWEGVHHRLSPGFDVIPLTRVH